MCAMEFSLAELEMSKKHSQLIDGKENKITCYYITNVCEEQKLKK